MEEESFIKTKERGGRTESEMIPLSRRGGHSRKRCRRAGHSMDGRGPCGAPRRGQEGQSLRPSKPQSDGGDISVSTQVTALSGPLNNSKSKSTHNLPLKNVTNPETNLFTTVRYFGELNLADDTARNRILDQGWCVAPPNGRRRRGHTAPDRKNNREHGSTCSRGPASRVVTENRLRLDSAGGQTNHGRQPEDRGGGDATFEGPQSPLQEGATVARGTNPYTVSSMVWGRTRAGMDGDAADAARRRQDEKESRKTGSCNEGPRSPGGGSPTKRGNGSPCRATPLLHITRLNAPRPRRAGGMVRWCTCAAGCCGFSIPWTHHANPRLEIPPWLAGELCWANAATRRVVARWRRVVLRLVANKVAAEAQTREAMQLALAMATPVPGEDDFDLRRGDAATARVISKGAQMAHPAPLPWNHGMAKTILVPERRTTPHIRITIKSEVSGIRLTAL